MNWKAIGKETLAGVKSDDVSSLAAGVAFKIFLSLFPSLLAGVAIWSLFATPADLQGLFDQMAGVLPAAAIEFIQAPLTDLTTGEGTGAGGIAIAGVLGGIWAATSAAVTLVRALNRAEDVEESRKPVRQRLVALAITTGLFVALLGLVVLLVMGRQLQETFVEPLLPGVGLAGLVTAARFGAAVLVLVTLFGFVYWVGPNRPRPAWRALAPGAVVGVAGWLALSGGFALYARTAGNYNATYGSLAGVIVTLLWLQLSMLTLLLGAELNAAAARVRARAATARPARPSAGRGAPTPAGEHPDARVQRGLVPAAVPGPVVRGVPARRVLPGGPSAHDGHDPRDRDGGHGNGSIPRGPVVAAASVTAGLALVSALRRRRGHDD